MTMKIESEAIGRFNRRFGIRLRDGSRIEAILPPASPDGAHVSIRRFSKEALTMPRLVEFGALSGECAAALNAFVKAKLNIVERQDQVDGTVWLKTSKVPYKNPDGSGGTVGGFEVIDEKAAWKLKMEQG